MKLTLHLNGEEEDLARRTIQLKPGSEVKGVETQSGTQLGYCYYSATGILRLAEPLRDAELSVHVNQGNSWCICKPRYQ